MTFWKVFFDSSISVDKIDTHYKTDKLLVEKVPYQGKVINIHFSTDKHINLIELEKLCDAVGWLRRPLSKVRIAIEHSIITISLIYKIKAKRVLVGFARATSDCAFNATIWDVVVHPDLQGYGLGSALIHQIIQKLRDQDINTITLFADAHVISFYHNLGFISDPDGVKGMFWYPR
uniref:GCN5-like N-acetyltransferase n=1 Tax=Hildenbrandia rivularis TaxID=135206 RepID=A0A1C9CFJ8_9FLOR|nr:GCN5-like N-acetyltransferase [Hildenbrandia rivularis]AOM67170.1 GCN5-like N-acetyltransferase [Hildenbrandia rivularis]